MRISSRWIAASLVVVSCLTTVSLAGSVTFTDSFEGYNIGALDKDYAGPNAAPNGTGNPWFGPNPPNVQIITSDVLQDQDGTVVSPHSGNQMARGAFVSAADSDQDWYNIAYRLNCGHPLAGSVTLDWWFFDPLGPGGGNFRDYMALGYYDTAPADTDHPANGSLNTGATKIQRLSLGATNNTGVDTTRYQARVVGATDGYTAGWFNLNVGRTVGWHHARIVVGDALPDKTNSVSFYIDNMDTPALTHNSMLAFGYNVVEINVKFGTVTGYYDDITLTAANDADNDGVLDGCDQCPGTPAGSPVDAKGCTVNPGDFNKDLFVNEADLTIFANCTTGPDIPYNPASLPQNCTLTANGQGLINADLDQDGDVDQTDFGIFQRCYSGTSAPDPLCAQ